MKKRFLLIVCSLFLTITLSIFTSCDSDDDSLPETWDWAAATEFGRLPKWSPDGRYVLFGDDRVGESGIYIWDIESTPVRAFFEDIPHNWDYCWSPQESKVAFSSPGAAGDSLTGIWLFELTTGLLKKVYNRGRNPCWFHNNEDLAVRIDNPSEGSPGIYRLSPAPDTALGEMNAELIIANGHKPLCSPVEDVIAYADEEISPKLHILDLEQGELFLSRPGATGWSWSGNGRYVAFSLNDYNSGTLLDVLWRVDINSAETADTLLKWALTPSMNAGGDQIAFTRVSDARWSAVWLFRNPDEVIRIADYGLNPVFDPTQERIALNTSIGGVRVLARIR